MNDEKKKLLKKLYEDGRSESTVREFCEENDIPIMEAYRLIADWSAPEDCKGCKYILFKNVFPCSSCSRGKEDMFEREREEPL